MSGKKDYEERKQMKKERYEELSEKARQRSKEHSEQHDRIANMIPLGQPIIVGHHSEGRYRRDIKRMKNAIEKSIREDEKANYYERKVLSIENNNVISSDDPKAIEKLQDKLKSLEEQKIKIKAREHEWYELPYINKEIKRIKNRIQELKELDELSFEDIIFNGGRAIHNKDENRLQILFDNKPDEETRDLLKSRGFKWSRTQGAWQRLYNKNGIYAVRYVINRIIRRK